ERLRESLLRFEPHTAVSPALIDAATGWSVYRKPERRRWVDRAYYWLLNGRDGFQPGRILRSGAAVGVDPLRADRDFYDVDWVPGGCVMHHREHLVLENFYPFRGKAYCEDIIHSFHLTSRRIGLRIVSRARCFVSVPVATQTIGGFAREMVADLRARRFFMLL